MSRTHICLGCGFELAGVRAPPDPHYGLPVVVCPRCELACVRHPKDPLIALFHNGLRLRRSLLSLGCQLILAFAIAASFAGMFMTYTDEFLEPRGLTPAESIRVLFSGGLSTREYGYSAAGEMAMMAVGFITGAIFTGAWLTSCLGHIRRRRVWPGAAAALALSAALVTTMVSFNDAASNPRLTSLAQALPPLGDFVIMLVMAGVFMVVALLGIPIGHGLKRVWASGAQAGRRRTRARRRRIREGH